MDEKMTTIIAGDGDLRQYLEKLAKELDTIYFIGTQSHQQMAKLFNVADVVVVPSVFEPFGLTALEALGCGTPVIASNVGGLRQIVNKQVGCLIEPGDYRTLALKVTSFIRDGLKEKVRFKAADYIRRNFSWEETNSNIERVYGRVNSWIA
ncbi:MAG: glycosyltransferase [Planctomycetes bacterium]|nr:glycosyltransferase [Planctomycetota bacterium]